MKTRLLFLAAFAAALTLLASCESDTPPGPTGDEFPLCEGNKSDDPSCHVALPGEDAVSSTDTEGSQPDTEQPAPFPTCSKAELPYPTGMWIKCDSAPRCQIEWHDDLEWGCVASCWEVPKTPPPTSIQDYMPQDFGTFTHCQPSP